MRQLERTHRLQPKRPPLRKVRLTLLHPRRHQRLHNLAPILLIPRLERIHMRNQLLRQRSLRRQRNTQALRKSAAPHRVHHRLHKRRIHNHRTRRTHNPIRILNPRIVHRRIIRIRRIHLRRERRRDLHNLHTAAHLRPRITRHVQNRPAAHRDQTIIMPNLRRQHRLLNPRRTLPIVTLHALAARQQNRLINKLNPVRLNILAHLRAKPLRLLHDVRIRHQHHPRLFTARHRLQRVNQNCITLRKNIFCEFNWIWIGVLPHVFLPH